MLEIIDAAGSYDLTTLAAVKAVLPPDSGADDAAITAAIHRASAMIATACNRVFARETVKETLRIVLPTDAILLPRAPVASLTSVVLNDVTLDPADYVVDAESGLLMRAKWEWWCCGIVAVTYAAGYTLPSDDPDALAATLPDDVQQATIALTRNLILGQQRDPLLRQEQVEGVGQQQWYAGPGDGLPADVAGIVDRWRLPAVA